MNVWDHIRHFFREIGTHGFVALFEKLRAEPHKTVAFTVAVVALGAKMAKADGLVTRDEVAAFRDVFRVEASAEKDVARLFNMARKDSAGFELYAQRIRRLFPSPDHAIVSDLVEGLFYIAMADGHYHAEEDAFLAEVARILGVPNSRFQAIRARAVPGQTSDPYTVLGLKPGASFETARSTWKRIVRECHPDALRSRGLPDEAIGIAERRLIKVNNAWEQIKREAKPA
jgi:DnaJ like chaperone protein